MDLTKTEEKKMFETTYHNDGSITVWDVYAQQWRRLYAPSARILSTLMPEERARVMSHCGIEE